MTWHRTGPRTGRAGGPGTPRLDVLAVVVVVVGGVLALRTFVVVPVRVDSASMEPTLAEGDTVLVTRHAPSVGELRRCDLVAFADPRDGRRSLKRVVGLPGERVVVLDGVLHVDGAPLTESWVDPSTVDGYYSRTFDVATGHVLLLGDNRSNSVDSRDYGAVPMSALRGRVLLPPWSAGSPGCR